MTTEDVQHSHLDVPLRPDHQDPDEWICTSVVEAIRDCLREGGFAQKKDNVETGGCFLVGGHGHLWRIDRDYQAGRSADPFDAVGCGGAFALGSLYETGRDGPEDRLERALDCAEHFSAGVRGPYRIVSA